DVLRRSPFFKAFLVMADVPEIYMQEFWAITYVHQHSIRFKMDTRKNIVDLEAFREMLHISPRVPGQSFDELPFEEEILDFLRFLGHSAQIKTLTDHGGSSIDEETGSKPGVLDVPSDDSEEEISWNSSDDEDVDDQDKGRDDNKGEKTDESDADDDDQDETEKDNDDDDDDDEEEIAKLDEQEATESGKGDAEENESDEESVEEETREKEEETFNPIPRTPEDSEDDGNGKEDQGLRVSEEQRLIEEEEADELYRDVDINHERRLQVSQDIEDSHVTLTPVQPDDRVKSLEVNFSEFMQTNQFAEAVSKIPVDLTEMELKKILIEKMEGNKSIQRSDEQQNLYKALVDTYEADKTILESYGDTAILKRRREDDDDQEGPSVGSDRGSKRQREGGEPESASTLSELATRSARRSATGTQSRQMSASESAFTEEPVQTTCQMDEPPHSVFETSVEDQSIVQTSQHPELFSQPRKPPTPDHTPIDFSNFIMNWLGVDTLTLELLAGPTYKLMRGSYTSLTELEYHLEEVYKATTDQLEWVNPEDYGHIKSIEDLVPRTMWIQEPLNYDKHTLWGLSHWGRKRQQFYGFDVNRESALDVYSKRRIIAVTELKIVEWHNYK
nr:hypothetical protein [Tanacetum cinerariifolium]